MHCKSSFVLFIAAAFVPASFSQATLISVPNGSFESAGGLYDPVSGWQIEGDAETIGTGAQSAGMPIASNGSQIGGVRIVGDGDPATGFTGAMSSDASLGTYAANTVYTLTFDVGGEGGWWGSWQGNDRSLSAGLGIYTGAGTAATPVLIDTTDLQEPAPTGGESYVLLPGAAVDGSDSYLGWKRFTVTLDTAADASAVGQDIAVILGWIQKQNHNKEMAFDNVTLDAVTAAVPEPSSFLLLGSMSLLALFKGRRVRS